MTTAPTDWPLPAAAWRRDLRQRLMQRLKRTRWVIYTATPRSLRVGPEGHAWLTTEAPPADDQPRRRHRRRGSRGQGITTDRVVPNACPGARRPPRRQRGDQWTLPAAESTPPGDDIEHRLARPNGAADRGLRADETSTQFAVQQIEQRFHLRWRFRWPQVRLARPDDGVRVPVHDDPQSPPVAGAFVAVPVDLGADPIEAAELFGQQLQAGSGDRGPPSRGSTNCQAARVSSASYTARRDSPVVPVRSKLRCGRPPDCSRAS